MVARNDHNRNEPSDAERAHGTVPPTRRIVRVAVVVLGLLLPAAASGPTAGAAGDPSVVALPVTFNVRNTNTSGLACPSDGARYKVRGSLVAPSATLAGAVLPAVTLYVHGFDFGGESTFHFRAVPAYDYARRMAELGQTSLVIDRLGYDSSGLPPGTQTCVGSAADVVHQVIKAMRRGSYKLDRRKPLRFSSIVLAGHDSGGVIAQVEAYSYRDVNGLIVLDFADTGLTPTLGQWVIQGTKDCATGGKEARPRGPGGYFDLGPPSNQLAPLALPNTDPALIKRVIKHRRRNPCGDLSSAAQGFSSDMSRLREVTVPVLIAAGAEDVAFSSEGVRRQRSFYTGKGDVSVAILANTGHFPMFGRTAPRFRAIVSRWLRTRFGCLVPRLKGNPLQAAKKAVRAADCRLGKVTGRKSGKVKGQRPKPGSVLPAGSKVTVSLG
jgi:pimeloyl-ACP methyl ester carboxylesterase